MAKLDIADPPLFSQPPDFIKERLSGLRIGPTQPTVNPIGDRDQNVAGENPPDLEQR
jgi:hypothetical protein